MLMDGSGDISTQRRAIEDFVAENLLTEAYNALQDYCRDYAPALRPEILRSRIEYEAFIQQKRTGVAPTHTTAHFQGAILDLCDKIDADIANPKTPSANTSASASTSNRPVVVCTDVTKSYAKGSFRLNNLSVTLRAGEITGIVGRNASGKTTLLRLMMGDLMPDGGRVEFPGWTKSGHSDRPDWMQIKRDVAYVPQFPGEWFGPLRQNLNYIASRSRQPIREMTETIDWNLARYELKRYEGATWDELSGGYKIRFELVRALISKPKLLILDEPLAYLDVVARQRFLEDLRSIASSLENPIPIAVTSQHLNEIEAVADQMLLINDGTCLFSGPISEIEALYPYKRVEVAVKAPRQDVEAALTGVALFGVERALDGYILSLDKHEDLPRLFARMTAAFGDRFTSMTDISRSSRGLLSEEV